MKTVFSNSEVCHVWAQQKQPDGRSSGGSIFFRDSSIYSYGSHFKMATFINDVVLVNSGSYSVTTSSHQSLVRRAITDKTLFVVPYVDDTFRSHNLNLLSYIQRSKTSLSSSQRARKSKDFHLTEAQEAFEKGKEYLVHFKSKIDRKTKNQFLKCRRIVR